MSKIGRLLLVAALGLSFAPAHSAVCGPAPKAAAHDCCGKKQPAQKVPCAQMTCCRVALPPSAVKAAPVLVVVIGVVPDIALPINPGRSELLPQAPDCGPPDRSQTPHSGLAPPASLA